MARSINWPPPAARAASTATAPTRPVIGSAMASPQKTGSRLSSHPTRPPATAASSPKATQSRPGALPAVAGDAQPHPARAARAGRPGRGRVVRGRGAGTLRSPRRRRRAAPPPPPARPGCGSRAARTLRPVAVHPAVERRVGPGRVGPGAALDLRDPGAGFGEDARRHRPGPERGQVDHPPGMGSARPSPPAQPGLGLRPGHGLARARAGLAGPVAGRGRLPAVGTGGRGRPARAAGPASTKASRRTASGRRRRRPATDR